MTEARHLPKIYPTGSANDRAGQDKGAVSTLINWKYREGKVLRTEQRTIGFRTQSGYGSAAASDAGWKGVHTVGRANGI